MQSIDKSFRNKKKECTTMITVPSYRLCILQLNIEYYISPIMNRCEIFLCIVKISVFDYSNRYLSKYCWELAVYCD